MAPALATRAGCLLSHFSSHLNRRWEGKRREKQFELNHTYEVQLCSPNSSNPDRTTLCHAFATCFTPLPSSSLVHSSVTSILQLKVSCYSHSPSTLMAHFTQTFYSSFSRFHQDTFHCRQSPFPVLSGMTHA